MKGTKSPFPILAANRQPKPSKRYGRFFSTASKRNRRLVGFPEHLVKQRPTRRTLHISNKGSSVPLSDCTWKRLSRKRPFHTTKNTKKRRERHHNYTWADKKKRKKNDQRLTVPHQRLTVPHRSSQNRIPKSAPNRATRWCRPRRSRPTRRNLLAGSIRKKNKIL